MTNLIILGASTRAAAFSALRAGLKPWCLDLFADLDLCAVCPAVEVRPPLYPSGLVALARKAPPGPWLYTGGLENRPRLVRRLTRERPLWGNGDAALRKARNPFALHRALTDAGVPCPDVSPPDGRTLSGLWLVKPVAGAGGAGIRVADGNHPTGPGEYLQAFQDGEPQSALFVAIDGEVRLLGVTRQLVGEDWLHAPPFRYCGSIGPIDVTETERSAWLRLGRAVAGYAGLRGLFGVDAVSRDGVPWPVEVNPRYTASVEVLEYASGGSALALHRRAFETDAGPTRPWSRNGDVVGKAIYYAAKPLNVPATAPWAIILQEPPPVTELRAFADIPAAGQRIPAGRPVVTVFSRGSTSGECEANLRAAAVALDRTFGVLR